MHEQPRFIQPDRVRPIVMGRGACSVSNRVLQDGLAICVMQRDEGSFAFDSGWCFTAGDEDESYCRRTENWSLHDVNVLANHDPGIVKFLDYPAGSVIERDANGELACVERPRSTPPGLETFPDLFDSCEMENWRAILPGRFSVRREGENLVLWRGGLTFWLTSYALGSKSPQETFDRFLANAPRKQEDFLHETEDGARRFCYGARKSWFSRKRPLERNGYIQSGTRLLVMAAYFDDEAALPDVLGFWRSLRSLDA